MKTTAAPLCGTILSLLLASAALAADPKPEPIDLPTALKLAGARNLDIQIARERVAEARANYSGALARFFPWIGPSVSYQQHDGKIQDVAGNILTVHKDSYVAGAGFNAQLSIGDALYSSLVTKQLAKAADHALESQRQATVLTGAQGYFDLAFAQGAVRVADEALRITQDYSSQIRQAVSAGLAFKGDELRVAVQEQQRELTLRQARERQRVAAARLAQVLHLDPAVDLIAYDQELAPLSLLETNTSLQSLLNSAMASRPELKESEALTAAAREEKAGAKFGPAIPTLGAQGFFGGLGGGRSGVPDSFGGEQDYLIGLSWRVGPGGLFDFTRRRAAESRLSIAELNRLKLEDALSREVVEAHTRWQSSADQVKTLQRTLETAEQALTLARQRREYAVGIVLEAIQAEQDLTRARLDYLQAVAGFNQAQYAVRKSAGQL